MSKGGKGGGSVQMPHVDTNPPIDAKTQTGFQTVQTATGDLSAYLNSLINPSLSLGNWAAQQATGGFAGGIPGINPALDYPFGANTETGFNFPAVGDIPNVSSEFLAPGYAGIPGQAYATGSQPYSGTGGTGVASPYYPGGTNISGGGTSGGWDWNSVGQAAGLSQSDINAFQSEGMTPDQVAARFGVQIPSGGGASGGGGGAAPGGGGISLDPGISMTATGPYVRAAVAGGTGLANYVPVGNGYYQQIDQTGINYPYFQLYDSPSEAGGKLAIQAQAPITSSGTGAGGGGGGGGGAPSGTTPVDNRGPLLTAAENALASEVGIAQQQPPGVDPRTISSLENQFFHNADPANIPGYNLKNLTLADIPGGTLPASGLYPQQEALVDTQTKAAQAATEQQLANEGLGSSTIGPELAGEIGQQGAAEKGTLIQGNIGLAQEAEKLFQSGQAIAQNAEQVAQNWAKLGIGEQTLGMAEQQQVFDFFSSISAQYGGLQQQMWSEAMQGYGIFSGIVNQLLESYGLSTKQNEDVLSAEAAQASAQAGVEEAQIAAQAKQSGDFMSSISNLLGSSASDSIIGSVIGGALSLI